MRAYILITPESFCSITTTALGQQQRRPLAASNWQYLLLKFAAFGDKQLYASFVVVAVQRFDLQLAKEATAGLVVDPENLCTYTTGCSSRFDAADGG
jgi:hypothetical protein